MSQRAHSVLVENFNCPQVHALQRGQFTAHNDRIQILYPNWHICQGPVSNFKRNPIAIVISGSGIQFLLKFYYPTSFKKGSERRNLPKDGEFKTQPVENKFKVDKYSKINKFQPPPSPPPPPFISLWEHIVSSYCWDQNRTNHIAYLPKLGFKF